MLLNFTYRYKSNNAPATISIEENLNNLSPFYVFVAGYIQRAFLFRVFRPLFPPLLSNSINKQRDNELLSAKSCATDNLSKSGQAILTEIRHSLSGSIKFSNELSVIRMLDVFTLSKSAKNKNGSNRSCN